MSFLVRQVTDIQARGVSLSWVAPSLTESEEEPKEAEKSPAEPVLTYEVSVSYNGKDGKYKAAYRCDGMLSCGFLQESETVCMCT